MRLPYLYGASVFVLSLLVHPTLANECHVNDPITNSPLIVSNLEELHAGIPANCTTIIGSITIALDFTGPFILNGITNVTGSIASPDPDSVLGADSITHLSSFEMQDLVSLGQGQVYYYDGILLNNVPELVSMSMPNATFISLIEVGGFSQASFDFSSLVTSISIEITGGAISSILLPSLVDVEDHLRIGISSASLAPRLDLELSALENASNIEITANLSRISMPLLSVVTGGVVPTSSTDYVAQGGLSITNTDISGSNVAMIFPQLKDINNTVLSGAIESVYLPALVKTQGDISITAFAPLAVNLSSLESVHNILLIGNISSINFPALTYLDSLNIDSHIYCNCTPAYTAYNTAWLLHGSNSTNNTYHPSMSCFSPPQPFRIHISMNAKIGIGLGMGCVGMILAYLCCRWWERHSKQGVKVQVLEEARVELDEMDLRDPPPAYESVVATEVGSLRSERTAVEFVEEGEGVQHELGDVHRESAAGDGDVSPVMPVERDHTRPL